MNISNLLAILLSFTSPFIGSLLAIIVTILLLPFGINFPAMLLFGALGGYFALQFGLLILFALLGDVGAALISWKINGSKKLALITFFSALIFQIISVTVFFKSGVEDSHKSMNEAITEEKSYTNYAKIIDISVEAREPFKFLYALNGKMTEVDLFKKLIFNISVNVLEAGTYEFYLTYNDGSDFDADSKSSPRVEKTLQVGHNNITIEMIAGSAPNLGYELPSAVASLATVQVGYLVSKKELMASTKFVNKTDEKLSMEIINNADEVISKFVEKKQKQF